MCKAWRRKVKNKRLVLIGVCFFFIILFLIMIGTTFLFQENKKLQEKIEFYENESIREATILKVTDCCVYVFDDYVNGFIEIDIFPELIHTKIEVGDTAVYVVDFSYTDADLIGIVKKE